MDVEFETIGTEEAEVEEPAMTILDLDNVLKRSVTKIYDGISFENHPIKKPLAIKLEQREM